MLKKILGKAAAGTAAASLVLVPGAVVAGPQFVNVACDYPGGYATNTDLRLDYTIAPYGTQNHANITVNSGTGTPQGVARLRVGNRGPWGLTLQNGEADRRVPRKLKAGSTYEVRANYRGKCDHNKSADTAHYTVTKAATTVNAGVAKKKRAVFNATVEGSGGLAPAVGAARFKVIKHTNKGTKTVRKGRVAVSKGYAQIDMKNLGRGNYTLKAIFMGNSNDNYKRGVDSTDFSVTRK